MKKIVYLVMAALGLVGEAYACSTYARDVSEYDVMLGGYLYDTLPFSTHETVITLIAIVSGLILIAGIVFFFDNEKESAKA